MIFMDCGSTIMWETAMFSGEFNSSAGPGMLDVLRCCKQYAVPIVVQVFGDGVNP